MTTRATEAMRRAMARHGDAAGAVAEHARRGAGTGEVLSQWADLDSVAAGPGPALAPILARADVTDVLVVGGVVWVDRGCGLQREDRDLGGEREVRSLAIHMAAAAGRRLDDSVPIVDGTLPDGTRLHAVIPPVSDSGTVISLRTSRTRAFTLDELMEAGTVRPAFAPVLSALVDRRANTLVCGSTGSGKTTLLAALLSLVPHDQRIICIEEVSELRPDHPHVVSMQERQPNVQGAGGVGLPQLVRAAMRMRPDRLVLGECRGPEVREVLTALNTGHEGGWATIHANTVEDVPARLAALGSLAGMDRHAVRTQAAAAFDAVIHMTRGPGGRLVDRIGVFVEEGEALRCRTALAVDGPEVSTGPGWVRLAGRLGLDAGQPATPGDCVPISPPHRRADAPSSIGPRPELPRRRRPRTGDPRDG